MNYFEKLFDERVRVRIQEMHKKMAKETPKLKMSIHGFEAIHGAERSGLNQEAGLLELLTRYHDLTNVKIEKMRSQVTLYIEYHILESAQGMTRFLGLQGYQDAKTQYYLTVKKGTEQRKILFRERDKDGTLKLPSDFIALVGGVADALLKKFKFEYELRTLCAVKNFKKVPETLQSNAFLSSLTASGWTVLDGMKFHESFTFKPEFIRTHGATIEFGYFTKEDYHSLPREIRLDFLNRLDVIRLSAINLDRKGKDGLHARYAIRAEQAADVKKFASSFKRKSELMLQ